jgi:SulP family sulfate permease
LAAVIIVAVSSLIKFDSVKYAWKIEKTDAVVFVITFLVTLFVAPNLEKGIIT